MAQLAVEALDVDRVELPGGDPLIDLAALGGGEAQDAADQPLEPLHRQDPALHAREARGKVGDGEMGIAQSILCTGQLRPQARCGGECVQRLLVPLVLLGPEGGEVTHLRGVEGGVFPAAAAEEAQHRLGLRGVRCDLGPLDEGLRRQGCAGTHRRTGRFRVQLPHDPPPASHRDLAVADIVVSPRLEHLHDMRQSLTEFPEEMWMTVMWEG